MNWDEIHPDDRIDAKLAIARGHNAEDVYKEYHGSLRSAHWRLGVAYTELLTALGKELKAGLKWLGLWR